MANQKAAHSALFGFLKQFYEPGLVKKSAEKAMTEMGKRGAEIISGYKSLGDETGLSDVIGENLSKAHEKAAYFLGGNDPRLVASMTGKLSNMTGAGLSSEITRTNTLGALAATKAEFDGRTIAGSAAGYFVDPFKEGRITTGILRAGATTAAAGAIGYGAAQRKKKKNRRY